ncbi:MAG: hypothetical protein K2X03_02330 [Bryobacteraceae bacterium]|nr:hypothetical protein [Bryobacteraceae bacterium]
MAHGYPGVVDRWSYYQRTLEAGCLLDEGIPEIKFCDSGDQEGFGMLRKAIELVYTEIGSWNAFPALIDWIAWGVAVSAEKPRFSTSLNEALYKHFNLGPLLMCPHDYLGALYAEGKGRWNPHAFFPTPHSVAECMTQMTMIDVITSLKNGARLPDGRDPRTTTVCDPCVGSARMLLHASNYSVCLYGCDIDPLCCRMSAINGVLYAPWLAFPFRAEVLGTATPAPPPGVLPLPEENSRDQSVPVFRVDDRGQGLLFEF